MKAVGGLFDGIGDRGNLGRALWAAARGKRHRPEVAAFLRDADHELAGLGADLRSGRFTFSSYRSFPVWDTKTREIHAPPFRDRVVHHAMIGMLGPVFERGASAHSYACRAGKGMHAALQQARRWTRRTDWYGKIDVAKFYDSVNHGVLRRLLRRRFREARVLALFDALLGSYETAPGKGLPIGALTSQYLGNFYLDEFDRWMKATGEAARYLRYMDDVVLWGERETLDRLRRRAAEGLAELGLRMKHGGEWNEAVRGIPFLGFVIYPDRIRTGKEARRRLRRKLGGLERDALAGRIGERELHDRGGAHFAHVLSADDAKWRAEVIRLSPWNKAFGETLEPASCDPGRLLEQRRQELPFRAAQQEQAWQSQSQPGLPGLSGSRHGRSVVPPDDAFSRSPAWKGGDEATEKPPARPEIPEGENGCAGAPTFTKP
jgi:hypothetical protein